MGGIAIGMKSLIKYAIVIQHELRSPVL